MKFRLLIIGGFALGSQPLQPLAAQLTPLVSAVHCIEPLLEAGVERFLHDTATSLQPNSIVLGWSLGGQLATLLAQRYPEKVAALITLTSNPCFLQLEDWPYGMPPALFQQFATLFKQQPQLALQQFAYLVSQGESRQKSLLTALKSHLAKIDPRAHLAGLTALRDLDSRAALTELAQRGLPQLHLLAENDALVDAKLIAALPPNSKQFQCCILPQAGHLAPFSQTDRVVEILARQLAQLQP